MNISIAHAQYYKNIPAASFKRSSMDRESKLLFNGFIKHFMSINIKHKNDR